MAEQYRMQGARARNGGRYTRAELAYLMECLRPVKVPESPKGED